MKSVFERVNVGVRAHVCMCAVCKKRTICFISFVQFFCTRNSINVQIWMKVLDHSGVLSDFCISLLLWNHFQLSWFISFNNTVPG